MFIRAVLAFLMLPGVVAFLVPGIWIWRSNLRLWPIGLILVVPGIIALLWCVRDFYVSGKGTLAPWSPPRQLVTIGLYRYSRNPMYIAVALILLGWAISFLSVALFIYSLIVAIAFHYRVVLGEEPWLAKVHGEAWQQYSNQVRRWL
jgi:protein-S-isoprenylcysteine O-methyltransferase Ste14